ncbi:MAG: L-alanine-DL-glutamate epimerase (EC [uncultured Thermomicrobiales bacterium]|uniref:Dipeptide epimerase n=1 Tax=uncultured Thermomicrobiales bacterium TaxID=1645740 RepID=A0A6J4UTS0_9BACT|nr:MAG: L-alanine-DL-glutamate epimerase (EC [uncultured Thermomicrobiales bacterium]
MKGGTPEPDRPLRIAAIDVVPVRLPLREPFVIAYASYADVLSVLVRVRTEDGAEGWGEATPDPNVTGETWPSAAAMLRDDLAPALLGHDARDRFGTMSRLDAVVEGAPAAKAALDIALHDLVARSLAVPLWVLLGGCSKAALEISRVVSLGTPEAMADAARGHVADGFSTVKLKVGDATAPLLDAARVVAVRAAVGPEIGIKVDANQGWKASGTAVRAIQAMSESQPAYVEQPVAAWDLEGLADVRRQTGATIMVDEGCHGARDLLRVVALRAADLVNIKLMKTGGIGPALRLNAIAEAAGIGAQVGTMVESSIASAAGLHVAIALANVATVEMGGPLMLAEDIGELATGYHGNQVLLPDGVGLGVQPDISTVRRFATSWHEVRRD